MKIDTTKLQLLTLDKTQAEIAEISGVGQPTISMLFRYGECSKRTLSKLSKAFNVPAEQLISK